MKATRVSALLATVALVAAACSDDGSGGEDFATINEGTLTVCTEAPFEPFEFQDEAGEFTGFDIELLRSISTNLGLDLQVTVVDFDGIWLRPAAGDCDLVGSAMTITDDRAENALFSDPYFDADQSLLVLAENAGPFATLDDLAGGAIGVQTRTTGEAYALDNAPEGADIVAFDTPPALFDALESGDVDAVLQDLPANGFRSTQDDLFVVTETFPTGEQYGFAASLDNPGLIEAVNAQLQALRDDGTYDAIFVEWFGEV